MVRRLLLRADVAVDVCVFQEVGSLRRQQQMVDADAVVPLPCSCLIVPETVDPGLVAMHLPHRIRDEILYANTHRELISYGSTEPVEDEEVTHLIGLGETAIEQARYVFPDWFL